MEQFGKQSRPHQDHPRQLSKLFDRGASGRIIWMDAGSQSYLHFDRDAKDVIVHTLKANQDTPP